MLAVPKTHEEPITEAVDRLRGKQKFLEKKHPFSLKWNYWDADSLRFKMRVEKTEVIEISTRQGIPILVTSKLNWSHPTLVTLRPDHLIDLFCTSPDQVNAILMAYKELGKFELGLMSAPGLSEMKEFCKLMDKEIVEVAHELRKQKIQHLFDLIWQQMQGYPDLLTKRIRHFRDLSYQYSMNREYWHEDFRMVGLLR